MSVFVRRSEVRRVLGFERGVLDRVIRAGLVRTAPVSRSYVLQADVEEVFGVVWEEVSKRTLRRGSGQAERTKRRKA